MLLTRHETQIPKCCHFFGPPCRSSNWSYETHQLVSSKRRESSTGMSNLSFSSHCQAHFDRLHCFGAARQRYLGVDILKELFENVESRNIIAFCKSFSNFYHCVWRCVYTNLIALLLPSSHLFLLSHELYAFNHLWHRMVYFVLKRR